MKILITGSSGLIGSDFISFLKIHNHDVYKLVRGRTTLKPQEIAWDPEQGRLSSSDLEGFDAIVHLAGESLMGLWTKAKKQRIMESRVKGTELLCQTMDALKHPPSVFISASAIGYYGNREADILTEEEERGESFVSNVCEKWEEPTRKLAEKGIRTVNLRIGIVLSPKGGALKQMLPIFEWGLGGQIGGGDQYISWIALEDVIRIIDYALHHKKLTGPINVVSPYPVTNTEFTKTLGRILNRPTFFSMPAFAAQFIFGEMADNLFLSSMRVKPEKLEEQGFQFNYPHLESALRTLLNKTE